MRNRRLHRKIIHLREVSKRRRLTSGERAILKFAESYTASEDMAYSGLMPKSPRSASDAEDEDEIRACGACEYETGDTEARFCASCGERLADVEDDSERRSRADEVDDAGEIRRGAGPTNDPGDTSYHGARYDDIIVRSAKKGAESAVSEFNRSYKKLRESSTFSGSRARGI